jgi:hypothetical protein
MLFTSPRTGQAIADELRRQYNPFNTRRKGAPSSGEQTERSTTPEKDANQSKKTHDKEHESCQTQLNSQRQQQQIRRKPRGKVR